MISSGESGLAIGYLRMSTDKQDASLARQRADIVAFAKQRGREIDEWFTDEAITGDSIEERPDFCRMLARGAERRGSEIYLWNVARFGRFDVCDAGRVVAPLRDAGTKLLVAADKREIDLSNSQHMILLMFEITINHDFLKKLSGDVTAGLRRRAADGKLGVSCAPIGMCRVFRDGAGKEIGREEWNDAGPKPKDCVSRIAPTSDPERQFERDAMVWAFNAYAGTSISMGGIVAGLRERGLRNTRGMPFARGVVTGLLRNAKYAGILEFGRFPAGKYNFIDSEGNVQQRAPGWKKRGTGRQAPPFTQRNAHEGLIPVEIFETVQRRLDRNVERYAATGGKHRDIYLLTHVLRCGTCGSGMYGCGRHGSGRPGYYGCDGVRFGTGCSLIRTCEIENYAVKLLDALVTSSDARDRVRARFAARRRAPRGPDAAHLRRALGEVERQIKTGQRNLVRVSGADLEALKSMLADLRLQEDALREKMLAVAPTGAEVAAAERVALRAIDEIAEILRCGSRRRVAEIIHDVFESITIYRRRIQKRGYLVKGRVVLRTSDGPLGPIPLHEMAEALRDVPALRKLKVVSLP